MYERFTFFLLVWRLKHKSMRVKTGRRMLREVLFQNDLSHYKCERLIEFYSKSVRMTNFTFFFLFFFFLRFFERWKRVFQRNWCWFLSRRGMELKIYIFSCLYHANILILFGYRRYEKKNDGKIRNFLIKYHKK